MGANPSNLQAKSAEVLVNAKTNLTADNAKDTAQASGCPYHHDQAKPAKSECPVTGASTDDDINPYNMV